MEYRYTLKYKLDNWLFDTSFKYKSRIEALVDLKQCSDISDCRFFIIDNVKDTQIKPTLFENIVVNLTMFSNNVKDNGIKTILFGYSLRLKMLVNNYRK
jgi:hypothetical protein